MGYAMTIDNKTATMTVKDTGDVVVHANGTEVVIHRDGTIIPTAANDTVVAAVLHIGDVLADKTVYAGELNGKKIFAAPQDVKKADGTNLTMTFNAAANFAKMLNEENYLGHNDWRVPTREELNVLYENKDKGALKDTFNLTASPVAGYYWSSTPSYLFIAYAQRFNNDYQNLNYRGMHSSVRCVR